MKIYPPNPHLKPNIVDNDEHDNYYNNNERLTINDAFIKWRLLIDEKIRLRSFTTILIKKYDVRIQSRTLYRWLQFVKQSKKDDSSLTAMYCEYKNINRILIKWKNLKYNTKLKSELALLDFGSLLHEKTLLNSF